MVWLNDRLCCVRVSCHQVLEIRIAQSSRDRKDPVDPVIENKPTGFGDALPFILIVPFVIIRQSQCFSVPAENDPRISNIRRVEDPLTGCVLLNSLHGKIDGFRRGIWW